MATGCFISTGRSLEEAIERVKLAESLGYESVYVTHIAGRESLTVITAYALATSRIRVGTGDPTVFGLFLHKHAQLLAHKTCLHFA